MTEHVVWDRFIRVFHIALATGFIANAILIPDGTLLHDWVGYALAALVLARIVWGFFGPDHARFISFLPNRPAIQRQIQDIAQHAPRTHLGHSPLGALMVINLLLTVLAICATGILLTGDTPAGWVEGAHEALVVWAELSILVHVTAVLWESLRTRVNLIGAMITGRKTVPDTIDIVE